MILEYCLRAKKKREILSKIGLSNKHSNFVRHVKPLIEKGWLIPTIPEKPHSGSQQYKTTPMGEKALKDINSS